MQESSRTPTIAVEPISGRRVSNWMLWTRLAFWLVLMLTLASVTLELGTWYEELKFAGPFAAETNPPRASLILQIPQQGRRQWWKQPPIGDNSEKPYGSHLTLRVDGREMGPPHTLHETIRTGKTTGFSHWGSQVIFSLPAGVTNGPETVATIRYRVRPRPWLVYALGILSAVLGYSAYSGPLRSLAARFGNRQKTIAIRAPYLILSGLCWAGLTVSAVYLLCTLYALAEGWALPTTALIRWSAVGKWAAINEPYLGYLLLMLAALGTATNWLVGLGPRHDQALLESTEQSLRRFLAWCGFPIVASTFIFCISTMWAGIIRPGDLHYSNIGGLLPFSDAGGYMASAFDQVKDGVWGPISLRRPLAAAFRSVLLVFGGLSLPSMLILQAALLAGATCFATHAIVVWRGIWAGITFFALAYISNRIFVPTPLTEPLGAFWALLSIPFLLRALRDRSPTAALLAFAMTSVALMTRMGSMFTIPALVIWLVWQFGKGVAAKLRIGVAAICILLGVFGVNSALQHIYGKGPNPSTGNFAYVLCGLSMGTTWDGCVRNLAAAGTPISGSEEEITRQLYAAAWSHLRADPDPFFQRLWKGVQEFYAEYPLVMWKGYTRAIELPGWLFPNLLTTISLIGLLYGAMRRAKAVEITFWTLLWSSIVASSAVIYLEEGSRVLAASQPLMALFFALGMSSLSQAPAELPSSPRSSRIGFIGLMAAAGLFVCVPWAAYRFSPAATLAAATPAAKPTEAVVYGGRRMSGFLVLDNDQPLRNDVPSLRLADFEAIIAQSGVESYKDLIHPVVPPLPFGFVFTSLVGKESSGGSLYIVPAEVVERRGIPAWHFDLQRWGAEHSGYGGYWFYVPKAEPWSVAGR